ncbi:ABC transporter permease [Microlunatus capsulatus]|uniref:ABC-2 type transport system permease protein n=1 Tax=Microlunatus capsulatus TaxID=99117 RepID=A0ABS4ZFW5_9ACTN|nr:ABC transporter permease [Microlunatus capsulatus]MBP2419128.1 ABC-2 type transport system permease protein [Microlunatus capsulatus]
MSALEERRLSPGATRTGGVPAMLAVQIGSEVTRYRRMPEYFVGVVILPVILFAMFGLPNAGDTLPGGTSVVAMIFVSFACYGVVSQALFSFGAELAAERQKGWLRRLRATPMPMWVYFAGKLAMNLLFTLTIAGAMALLAQLAGQADFDGPGLLRTGAVLLLGTVVFSPMGAAIAYLVRPRAVATIVNLVFLPLSFASGFFFPLRQLPQVLQDAAPWLPTYHFGQLARDAMAPAADVEAYGGGSTGGTALHLLVVLAWGVVCAAATVWGYRREAARERS